MTGRALRFLAFLAVLWTVASVLTSLLHRHWFGVLVQLVVKGGCAVMLARAANARRRPL